MRTINIFFMALVMSVVAGVGTSYAQTSGSNDAYYKAIERIMEQTDAKNVTINVLTETYVKMGLMDAASAKAALNEWFDEDWNAMMILYVACYKRYFTLEDLQNMIAFYDTPTGRKFAAHNAQLTVDAQQMMMSDQKILGDLESILMRYVKK